MSGMHKALNLRPSKKKRKQEWRKKMRAVVTPSLSWSGQRRQEQLAGSCSWAVPESPQGRAEKGRKDDGMLCLVSKTEAHNLTKSTLTRAVSSKPLGTAGPKG